MSIPGRWREGYVLDYHTLTSTFVGYDEFGHERYDTKRSEIGELLYRLKYQSDKSAIDAIVGATASFVRSWSPGAELIVPVPPSRARIPQPLFLIGQRLSTEIAIPFVVDCVKRIRDIPELKNVYDYDERLRLLADAHEVDGTTAKGRRVLLFDDLYRSGATMNSVAAGLYERGGVAEVFALALTRTRVTR